MTFNINLYALMFCAELLTRSLFSFYRSARFRPRGFCPADYCQGGFCPGIDIKKT